MTDITSKWQGGPLFVKIKRGGNGRHGGVGDGSRKKKFGASGMRKRVRFNPNPTRSSAPSCLIAAASAVAKKEYGKAPRPVMYFRSNAHA